MKMKAQAPLKKWETQGYAAKSSKENRSEPEALQY